MEVFIVRYVKLFSPGKIGALELKNRLVMTAMGCGLAELDGTLGEPFLAYYRQRAQGGVGLIVTEVTRVNETHGCMAPRQIRASDDRYIPELRKLADAVHEQGSRVFVQLHHPGNVTYPALNAGHLPVSASDIPSLIRKGPILPLTQAEIGGLVQDFAAGAYRAQQAGIDGVEIHAGHFYLIHQFLSPYFNKRTDAYGGSTENRSRFLLEIIAAIRARCGDYPIAVRLSVEEYLGDEGYHLNEGIQIARLVEQAGADAIDVTAAGTGARGSQSLESVSYQQGWRRHLGAAVKRAVQIPVIAVSLAREPGYGEDVLKKGQADFVGSGRCFLADPAFASKAQQGREEEIRKCISCLRCIENIKDEKPIVCSINPDCGRESIVSPLERNGAGRLVIVLGGGPAGLEAARIAAERGFRVELYEKSEHLGGAVYLAAQVPHKDKMLWFIEFERQQCEKLGVRFSFHAALTTEQIRMRSPYAVLDATGAVPVIPHAIPGIDKPLVYTNVDVLSGQVDVTGAHVAVIGSGLTGLETAEFLMERGNAVTVIEMAPQVAPGANPANVFDVLPRLLLKNTVTMTGTALTAIGDDRIFLENVATGLRSDLPVDIVVLSMGVRPGDTYGAALAEVCQQVVTIGDAKQAGRIMEAVCAGNHAATNL